MAPYEVFADSPRFSVYTIAASGAPAPVDGGPAIVPTYTFADSAAGVAPPPDVVVVPAVTTPDGPEEAALRTWIVQQSRKGAHILGICAGARILAATGLLRGRAATSHWSWLDPLKDQHPEVHWVAGQRFVQDGLITTTAGITSGIPGALRVMKDLAGEAEAARVGQLVDYPGWSPTQSTDIPVQSFALSDLPVGLNAVVPWLRPTVGIALHDGIGEIDLASAFEVYTVSYPARTIPLTATGTVTTKHGMVLVTPTSRDAPPLTRLLAPGAGGTAAWTPAASVGRPAAPTRRRDPGSRRRSGFRRRARIPGDPGRAGDSPLCSQDDRLPHDPTAAPGRRSRATHPSAARCGPDARQRCRLPARRHRSAPSPASGKITRSTGRGRPSARVRGSVSQYGRPP